MGSGVMDTNIYGSALKANEELIPKVKALVDAAHFLDERGDWVHEPLREVIAAAPMGSSVLKRELQGVSNAIRDLAGMSEYSSRYKGGNLAEEFGSWLGNLFGWQNSQADYLLSLEERLKSLDEVGIIGMQRPVKSLLNSMGDDGTGFLGTIRELFPPLAKAIRNFVGERGQFLPQEIEKKLRVMNGEVIDRIVLPGGRDC